VGVREYDQLPQAARNYLDRLTEIVGTPIDVVSTGPDRADTIVLRDPFAS
jgi:adenylosuccinate synthase